MVNCCPGELAIAVFDVISDILVKFGENYFETKKKQDWLRCKSCGYWAHENCTEFDTVCHTCGLEDSQQEPKEVLSGQKRRWTKTRKNLR